MDNFKLIFFVLINILEIAKLSVSQVYEILDYSINITN
jgi:hypothetical protein